MSILTIHEKYFLFSIGFSHMLANMTFQEQRDAALAEFEELLAVMARGHEAKLQMEALALDLRAGGVDREELARRAAVALGKKVTTTRKAFQTLEGHPDGLEGAQKAAREALEAWRAAVGKP
ncbi:hypothetical protein ABZ470_39935 [Streptosporangium sp. NPDC020072]|uniref:hypothetical protein n=1 Tax=Streptosporangium sp. NPDC020072 TaxID=3154788 RepID=UPI0034483A32